MYPIAIALHAIAATVWIGGMFFMLVVFRPAVMALTPEARTPIMAATIKKFFPWVWMAIVILLITGYALVGAFGGFGSVPFYVHIMHVMAWVMIGLYAFMVFKPYKTFRSAVESGDKALAMKSLNTVRWVVTLNLILGLVLVSIVTGGRYA